MSDAADRMQKSWSDMSKISTLQSENERLRQLLGEAVAVAEAEYKSHCTGSGFDSQPARSTAHRILEAIKALQSEDR